MKKRIFKLRNVAMIVACLAVINGTQGQNFGNRLKDAVKNSAENAAVRKAEQKTDEAVSKSIDKAADPNSYKNDDKDNEKNDEPKSKTNNQSSSADDDAPTSSAKSQTGKGDDPQGVKSAEMAYAKSDFVPGDEIIFDDPMTNEKLGEFPSQWDLLRGNAEVATFNGLKGIFLESPSTSVAPLMKNMKNYLPDEFTVELDFWVNDYLVSGVPHQRYFLNLLDENDNRVMQLRVGGQDAVHWEYLTPDGSFRSGELKYEDEKTNSWNHLSVSFNKRAFKAYINGIRVTNVPNMATPKNLAIEREHWQDHRTAITNVRIAKGAVPLYDRMMSDGKFISYGITFDVGKSTIKPESMGEINRIVTLMKENSDLKFSVEGHTDNTGTSSINQTLSEARSQAVMAKLIEMGISKDRLKAAGKGQNSPIADNNTDEGRAKNRRVEFVKF